MGFIILLIVITALWYRATSPEERKLHISIAIGFLKQLKVAATRPRPEYDRFREVLRTRSSYALVTLAFAVIIIAVFIGMLSEATAVSDPATLLAWGASLGTRTTNGEWWRLVTSAFVHTSTVHLLIDLAVLIQVGAILERLVGRLTVIAVYFSAGVFDCLVHLSSYPVGVTVSSSGAIFGLYGLLLASVVWQMFHTVRSLLKPETQEPEAEVPATEADMPPARVTIPLVAMKRLGIGAAVFVLYSLFSGRAHAPEFLGMLVGLMYGIVLARRAGEKRPRPRDVAYPVVATSFVVLIAAIALRNIADVKPEIARVLATEKSTSGEYQTALDTFKKGRMTAEALAELAERTIVPELEAADARLEGLTRVPPEHQQVVVDAREFLRLRCASWRARSAALRRAGANQPQRPDGIEDTTWRLQLSARYKTDMSASGKAEGAERESMQALHRIATF